MFFKRIKLILKKSKRTKKMAQQPEMDQARKVKSQVSTAMYLHTMGLTDSACHDLGLIKTYEGVDTTMRRMIASMQYQGGYYDEVLKTL